MLTLFLHDPGFRHIEPLQRNFERRPGKTPSLATTTVEPFEGTPHGMREEASQSFFIAADTEVVVVAHQFSVQFLDKLASRQMAVAPDPQL